MKRKKGTTGLCEVFFQIFKIVNVTRNNGNVMHGV